MQCLSHEGSGNAKATGSVLATEAVETQRQRQFLYRPTGIEPSSWRRTCDGAGNSVALAVPVCIFGGGPVCSKRRMQRLGNRGSRSQSICTWTVAEEQEQREARAAQQRASDEQFSRGGPEARGPPPPEIAADRITAGQQGRVLVCVICRPELRERRAHDENVRIQNIESLYAVHCTLPSGRPVLSRKERARARLPRIETCHGKVERQSGIPLEC